MKSAFLKLEQFTSRLSMMAACAMLTLAASLGVFQIVTRFVLETPAEWTEVIIRFSLIWMVFLGIPEDVSMFWAYLALPVGGVFSILGIIGNLLDPQRLELETAQ